ncbi:hypothetical protein [Prosthecobacter vanneervenii]|uniref:Uncharacterized protein n=1 Tax=Prosthecobacter vanneervenii TaxID=48466 RepID=A0A7W7YCZ1_9BACT|nr:hypothetical protein [Prosthecobacter vanneervenii]MBB5033898.1 hypothetical protein [Prosthecobacter vanneervenii]
MKIEAERAPPFYPDHYPLIAFQLSYEEMVTRFGLPHRVMDENDNEPCPCEYWSFLFPCGLSIFIAFHLQAPTGPTGSVYASSRDIGHILEHLPVNDCVFWRLDIAEPDLYRERGGILSSTCPCGTKQNA